MSDNNYYLKYLKYKKKYSELSKKYGHKSRSRSNSTFLPMSGNSGLLVQNSGLNAQSLISPLSPSPVNLVQVPTIVTISPPSSPRQAGVFSSGPSYGSSTSGPSYGSSTSIVSSLLSPSTSSYVSSYVDPTISPTGPRYLRTRTIGPSFLEPRPSYLTSSNGPLSSTTVKTTYDEFSDVIDLIKRTFTSDEFLRKFNLNYKDYPVKTYNNRRIEDYIFEKNQIENTLLNANILSKIGGNTLGEMMQRLLNKVHTVPISVHEQYELQNLIKSYVILDSIIDKLR